jgi:hypothetical protein
VRTGAEAVTAPLQHEYLRWWGERLARGQGAGRAILEGLLADARALGYRVARLETAVFMREAQALYRSLGFRERPVFDGSGAGLSGLDALMLSMELRLSAPPPAAR